MIARVWWWCIDLLRSTDYSAGRGEEREGWWRWGMEMETTFDDDNNNDNFLSTSTPMQAVAHRYSPSLPPRAQHPTFRPSTRVHHFFHARPRRHAVKRLRLVAAGNTVESPSTNHHQHGEHWRSLLLLLAAATCSSTR